MGFKALARSDGARLYEFITPVVGPDHALEGSRLRYFPLCVSTPKSTTQSKLFSARYKWFNSSWLSRLGLRPHMLSIPRLFNGKAAFSLPESFVDLSINRLLEQPHVPLIQVDWELSVDLVLHPLADVQRLVMHSLPVLLEVLLWAQVVLSCTRLVLVVHRFLKEAVFVILLLQACSLFGRHIITDVYIGVVGLVSESVVVGVLYALRAFEHVTHQNAHVLNLIYPLFTSQLGAKSHPVSFNQLLRLLGTLLLRARPQFLFLCYFCFGLSPSFISATLEVVSLAPWYHK